MDDADRAQMDTERLDAARLKQLAAIKPARPSLSECEECGGDIPRARQLAVPGVTHCIECAQFFEMQHRGRR